MKLPTLFSNRQFRRIAIIVGLIVLVYLVIIILKVGGDSFIFSLSSFLNAPLAIAITLAAFAIYYEMGIHNQPRRLWSGMVLGWGLWALAETIWLVYSLLGKEVPYPGAADLFWVVGYIPMGYGLMARIRGIPVKSTLTQRIIITVISLATVIVTSIFIFLPIIQYFDAGRLVESILNFIYPLADLFITILVLRLLISYEKGDYGFSWRLLASGFILMTISDFLFTYATWQEIYYPDMQATLLSRLFVDAPYTVCYFVWFVGIFALRSLLKEPPPVDTVIQPKPVPFYGHVLIATKADDTIIQVSPNVIRLLEAESYLGNTLAEGLTITERDGQAILKKLHEEGRIADLPIQVRNRSGYSQPVRLCGTVVKDVDKKYMGSNLLLRVQVNDQSFNNPLGQEAKDMIGYILEKSGSSYSVEIANFLLEYYRAYLKELFKLAFSAGGESMTRSLVEKFKELSNQHQWKLQFNLQTGMTRTIYPLGVIRQALPVLLQTAKDHVSNLMGSEIVETRMREVDAQFSEAVHRDVTRYLRAGAEF